ncbi:hypothetical protein [Myxococcus hansupus]|nr:hypothetical protein [Myxococcus hansupus]
MKKVLKATTRTLSCSDGLMWSVGEHSIVSTVDGTSWERVEAP